MTISFAALRLPMSILALATLCLTQARAEDILSPISENGALGDPAAVIAPTPALSLPVAAPPPAVAALPVPSMERPLRGLYCVEYARLRSGLAVFGDAKFWWQRAKSLYDEFAEPAADAVMVFAGSKRIRKGHVAVVSRIVGPREILVDHANWQNHGEIDHATPVLDVSAANDWSLVRVWNLASGQFGTHVYAIKGFIARALPNAVQPNS